MAGIVVYRLEPRSPFHLGERGVGIEATGEIVHSDTLFSAVCHAILEANGEASLLDFLAPFLRGQPPFLLSSGLPYAGPVFFFPKPRLRPDLSAVPMEAAKLYKSVRFITRELWSLLLAGKPVDSHLTEGNLIQDGVVWLSGSDREKLSVLLKDTKRLWGCDVAPRVTIDRVTSASSIYHAGRLVFAGDCGIFFLVSFSDDSFRPILEEGLRFLQDAGLGGERSCGHGQFTFNGPEPFELPANEDTNAFLTLSLYCPTAEELTNGLLSPGASYEVVERRGWIYSPRRKAQRRKGVHMFAEGSVLARQVDVSRSCGSLVDVTPDASPGEHRVYRYGFAFPVPLNVQEVGDG